MVANKLHGADVRAVHPIFVKLFELFCSTAGAADDLRRLLSQHFSLALSDDCFLPTLLRLQWAMQLSLDFVPSGYRPIPRPTNVLQWPLELCTASWIICPTCGRREPRSTKAGTLFQAPASVLVKCSQKVYPTGCQHNCYRQLDLELNGVSATCVRSKPDLVHGPDRGPGSC